jgi:hypothetical protein
MNNHKTMYLIYDENGEPMRMVRTLHEAQHLIKTYTDWSYRCVAAEPPPMPKLPEALF